MHGNCVAVPVTVVAPGGVQPHIVRWRGANHVLLSKANVQCLGIMNSGQGDGANGSTALMSPRASAKHAVSEVPVDIMHAQVVRLGLRSPCRVADQA